MYQKSLLSYFHEGYIPRYQSPIVPFPGTLGWNYCHFGDPCDTFEDLRICFNSIQGLTDLELKCTNRSAVKNNKNNLKSFICISKPWFGMQIINRFVDTNTLSMDFGFQFISFSFFSRFHLKKYSDVDFLFSWNQL